MKNGIHKHVRACRHLFCVALLLLLTTLLQAQSVEKLRDNNQDSLQSKTILFLGNSLTAGYGLDPSEAFPALVQQKIDSLGWHFEAVNAGLSGETSAGGLRRLSWLLKRPVDVLVLELGANDGLRGFSPKLTEENLAEIIRRTRLKNPRASIVLAGMEALPNMGEVFVREFRAVYPRLAKISNAALIPFLLEGVAGIPALNLPDGIHPTARGHRIVAENVWKVLEPILQKMQQSQTVQGGD